MEKINLDMNNCTTKISMWNINGFVNNFEKLEYFINEEKPDILCLNEIKNHDQSKIDKITSDKYKDYNKYYNLSLIKYPGGYSGVSVWSKYKPNNVYYGMNNFIENNKHDNEGRLITLEFDKYYLVCVYVPNSGRDLKRLDYRTKEWDVDFNIFINKLLSLKYVIISGDMNTVHKDIDIHNPKTKTKRAGVTVEEKNNFDKLLDLGLIDIQRYLNPKTPIYTWWYGKCKSLNKGWRLDYFLMSKNIIKNVINTNIHDTFVEDDHCPISLTFNEIQ